MRKSVMARKLVYAAATLGVVLFCGGARTTAAEPAPKPPGVWSGIALEVQGTTVVLQGWVKPRGEGTTYHFQLGMTKSYGIAPELNEAFLAGYRNHEVSEAIPRLRHRTTYHFRLVAHSRGGTTYGKDKTFRTLGPAAP